VVDQSVSPEPILNAGSTDFSNWEAEEEPVAPHHDEASEEKAIQLHDVLAAAKAINDGEDWSDLQLELPPSVQLEATLSAALLGLFREGIGQGFVSLADIESSQRREVRTRRETQSLKVALGEFGVIIRGRYWANLLDNSTAGNSDRNEFDLHDQLAHVRHRPSDLELSYTRSISEIRHKAGPTTLAAWQRLRDDHRSVLIGLLETDRGRELIAQAVGDLTRDQMPTDEDDLLLDDQETTDGLLDEIVKSTSSAQPLGEPQLAVENFDDTSAAVRLHEMKLPLKSIITRFSTASTLSKHTAEYERLRPIFQRYERTFDRIVTENLKLVLFFAKRYRRSGIEYMDLIQEGNLGLMRAVERFDSERGNSFGTYASWWVRQAITRAIADKARSIRIPVHVLEAVRKVDLASRRLESALGRPPSALEIAEDTQLSESKVTKVLALRYLTAYGTNNTVSLRNVGLVDQLKVAPEQEGVVNLKSIRRLLEIDFANMDSRIVDIIRRRFGFHDEVEQTLEEIGQKYGVTRERIRQIEAKGLRMLKGGPRPYRALMASKPFSES
jgi:RNA polymerase sigma factor (sigma-70 family)